MHFHYTFYLITIILNNISEGARILAIFSCPSISHQVVFRPLTHELARRGHEVVVVTTDPAFPKGETPGNLTEIDVHDLSYSIWQRNVIESEIKRGQVTEMVIMMTLLSNVVIEIFEQQMYTKEVQEILGDFNEGFDLILAEAIIQPALAFSHRFKAPVIQISSFLPFHNNMKTVGASIHPILYPAAVTQNINNLSFWGTIQELYSAYMYESLTLGIDVKHDAAIKRVFGDNMPPIHDLYNNVQMLILNTYAIWESNRPVPLGCLYVGGLHQNPEKELPKDLQVYLDSSKNGVIYVSYGTNLNPSTLQPETLRILVKVFSKLPYDVLWKWDKDDMPGKPSNLKLMKWLPQSDLLRHPMVKLFITQAGLQSTDEAISAGVPMIGMPTAIDQWFNSERYVQHKIGLRLDWNELTETRLEEAIKTIISDESYRSNVRNLYKIMEDRPQTSLKHAVWWTEHVLRHGGAAHLRAPAANLAWSRYYELPLIAAALAALVAIIAVTMLALYNCIRLVLKGKFVREKLKRN